MSILLKVFLHYNFRIRSFYIWFRIDFYLQFIVVAHIESCALLTVVV